MDPWLRRKSIDRALSMVVAYGKSVKTNLSPAEISTLPELVKALGRWAPGVCKMDKKLFSDLVMSLKHAGQIAQGKRKLSRVYRFSTSRVKAIRART